MTIARNTFTNRAGAALAIVGTGYFIQNYGANSVAVNAACRGTVECVSGLLCTAEYNTQFRYLAPSLPGHCIDPTGALDSAPGVQADLDTLPVPDINLRSVGGLPYKFPPGSSIKIGSPAGLAGGTVVGTGCTITSPLNVIQCSSAPFRSVDDNVTTVIPGAGVAGADLPVTLLSFDATGGLNGKHAFFTPAATTPVTNVTISFTRLRIGLYAHWRVFLDGNGAALLVDRAAVDVGLAVLNELVGDPLRGSNRSTKYSRIENINMYPTAEASPVGATTTWGLWLNANYLHIEHNHVHGLGRCFYTNSALETYNNNDQIWIGNLADGCSVGFLFQGPDNNTAVHMDDTATNSCIGIWSHESFGSTRINDHTEGNGLCVAVDSSPTYNGLSRSIDYDMGVHGYIDGGYIENSDPDPVIDTTATNAGNSIGNVCFSGGGITTRISDSAICKISVANSRQRWKNGDNLEFTMPATASAGGLHMQDRSTTHGDGVAETFGYQITKAANQCGTGTACWGWKAESETDFRLAIAPNGRRGLFSQGGAIASVWSLPTINHGSITTLTTLVATGTTPNGNPGDPVVCTAQTTPSQAGQFISHAWYSAQDTVSIGLANAGATADPAAIVYSCRSGMGQAMLRGTFAIDHGSIAAADNLAATATMPGLRANDVVWCSPRAPLTAGLAFSGARASATDTLSVTLANLTAGAIDPVSLDWDCFGGGTQNALIASGSVDHGSIAAGTVLEANLGMTGLQVGMAASCSPRVPIPTGLAAGRVRAAVAGSQVAIPLINLTGSPIDPAAITWDCKGFKF